MKYTIKNIVELLDKYNVEYHCEGKTDAGFDGFCPLNRLKDNSLTWVRNADNLNVDELNQHHNLVLIAENGASIPNASFSILYVPNAHRTFFRIVQELFAEMDPEIKLPQIASTAVVETEQFGEALYVGHHTVIEKGVKLGNHVTILNNVTIQGNVTIGDYTTIESGTVIGACGFGHYWDEEERPIDVPHFGGVVIGNHVKIGASNTISRGCLADTVIEDYVKTDNLVHIAHNDYIKYGAMLTACVEISGSTTVGKNAWLAPGTAVREGIELGDDIYTGIGTVITKSQPAGKVVVGVPAKVLRDRKKDEH